MTDDGVRKRKRNPSPLPVSCCTMLSSALDYARAASRPVAGLQVAAITGEAASWTAIVYVVPARGRGQTKVAGATVLMGFCPFCGQKPTTYGDGRRRDV